MNPFKSEKGRQAIYASYDKLIASWGVPVEQVDLDTSYGRTHVLLAGEKRKPPLVLFHGVGDNAALMWINNARDLARYFYLVAVDTLGGPGKSCPDQRYGYGFELCTWFCDLLRALKLTRVHLAGVSYGCYLAQHFLINCPENVERVVGIAGYPNARGYKMGLAKRMLTIFLPVILFPSEKRIQELLKKLAGPGAAAVLGNKELYSHWRLLLKYFRNDSLRFHRRQVFTASQYNRVKERLLFLMGEQDAMCHFPEALRAIKDLGLNLEIIPHSAHTVNYDKAPVINKIIVNFLNQKLPDPA